MKHALLAVSAALLSALVSVSLAPMSSASASVMSLTGTWKGTGSDYFEKNKAVDGMKVTWVMAQAGSDVTGTVTTTGLSPGDGSCSDCHRAKTGTLTGTVSGASLTLTMNFPGHNGEVTSDCTAIFSGSAAIADLAFTLAYTGTDSCEGAFSTGSLPVTRMFTDDVLTAGMSTIRAVHIEELRTRIDAVRARYGLAAYAYVDVTLTAGTTGIRAQHIVDLRAALAEAYVAAGRTAPAFTDSALAAGMAIKAAHIAELRAAVTAVE